MKFHLGLLAALAFIPVAGVAHADPPSFLKPGTWYQITAGKSMPLSSPYNAVTSSEYNVGWVQVLQLGPDQWCYVEFDRVELPHDAKGEVDHRGQVTINKDRMWINFAQVSSVQPMAEPNYAGLRDKFAGGVRVVAYAGSGT
ncbi:MAG: hypothetical protein WDO13_12665 [Verrucomicrobiota bacterium]